MVYWCRQSPNACCVVVRLACLEAPALAAKMGVPVNPKRWYFLNFLLIAMCMSPNWLRWHSSKMMTTCCWYTACCGYLWMNALSFWIVVTWMRLEGSERCLSSTAELVEPSTAPFSNFSYSRMVW